MQTLTHEISPSQNAVVVAGQEALLSRLSQSQEACDHLKEQLEALRRHSLSLQESCTSLQTLNTQLQVMMAEFDLSKWTSCLTLAINVDKDLPACFNVGRHYNLSPASGMALRMAVSVCQLAVLAIKFGLYVHVPLRMNWNNI